RTRVFERFQRGGSADTSGGTGLGLAIARWAAGLHGGTVEVLDDPRSEAARDDRSSLIRVTLPDQPLQGSWRDVPHPLREIPHPHLESASENTVPSVRLSIAASLDREKAGDLRVSQQTQDPENPEFGPTQWLVDALHEQ